MKQICKFDPVRDVRDVDTGCIIDINDILRTGVVPSSINSAPLSYNGIEDPTTIIGRPSDTFDALRMNEQILSSANTDISE